MNEEKEAFGIKRCSDALDSLFDNNLTDDVVIRFETGGYVLYLKIRNSKTEIIVPLLSYKYIH